MVASLLQVAFQRLSAFFSRASTPRAVTSSERISRFVLDKKHCDATRIKFRAFEPRAADPDLSVSRTEGMNEADIWAYATEHVANPSGRSVYARGDLTRAGIEQVTAGAFSLTVAPAEPPIHHAAIIGWPSGDQKEVRRSLAQQLAEKATRSIKPDS
jgi:hypothetical protein